MRERNQRILEQMNTTSNRDKNTSLKISTHHISVCHLPYMVLCILSPYPFTTIIFASKFTVSGIPSSFLFFFFISIPSNSKILSLFPQLGFEKLNQILIISTKSWTFGAWKISGFFMSASIQNHPQEIGTLWARSWVFSHCSVQFCSAGGSCSLCLYLGMVVPGIVISLLKGMFQPLLGTPFGHSFVITRCLV